MPYNTRRKSLSLAELGIILPKRSRAPSHPSPPSTINGEEPPSKRVRIAPNGTSSMSPPPAHTVGEMSPPRKTSIKKEEKRQPAQLSPPPSPFREGEVSKVDTEGINDDVVIGTIEQLEKTGNRPHLVKELAAVLATSLAAVEKSANPCALISSRLTSYLNRTRPAFVACPIEKRIEPVHPRRLYFHLTTMPKQPFPSAGDMILPQNRITPSLSSADEEDNLYVEEPYIRSRVELSPSPEIDLSSPELEDDEDEEMPSSPARSFPTQTSIVQDQLDSPKDLSHNRRAVSPQLEPEERTFKQTANDLQVQAQIHRQNSLKELDMADAVAGAIEMKDAIVVSVEPEDSEENTVLRNQEAAAELFEHADHLHAPVPVIEFSSPMIAPQVTVEMNDISTMITESKSEGVEHMQLDLDTEQPSSDVFAWDNLQSPENIALQELEDMFDSC